MSNLQVLDLTKIFDGTAVVDHISFEIKEGEIVTLLGPSGCGKSTTLRCIAGLEDPNLGEISLGSKMLFSTKRKVNIRPEKRGMAMVFQSYAVWPHMNVFNNVAYGLKARKYSKEDIKKRVKTALDLVGLEGMGERNATLLSGGQQQRVALARSLVLEPELILLDEPLSNLDAKLREYMRIELKEIQRRTEITFLYVTHDQQEAIVISDRLIILNKGRCEQVGTPLNTYRYPASEFVADFMGVANILSARVIDSDKNDMMGVVEVTDGSYLECIMPKDAKEGDAVSVCLRPENIKMDKNPSKEFFCKGKVAAKVHLGEVIDYYVTVGEKEIRVRCHPTEDCDVGEVVYISQRRPCHVLIEQV